MPEPDFSAAADRPSRRRWTAAFVGLLAVVPGPTAGQNTPKPARSQPQPQAWVSPTTLFDPRLESIRMASASWEFRTGPERRVVDQVCLVPDLATFFEAIGTWDESHYFPILIDDVESTFRFIRAFKPARIVRYPKAPAAMADGEEWGRAVAAVAASWGRGPGPGPAGDAVPTGLGPTPPGVVLSSPTAPMLAGAVALAAGRFQPLVRLDSARKFADVLSPEEFQAFDRDLTAKVRAVAPRYDQLADGCDFLTIAGDWPYRYHGQQSQDSVDDGLGRAAGTGARWAFAGRLLGGPAASVYRAMCSLFLQPESAAMFNGYEEAAPPWSDFAMRAASLRMASLIPTAHVAGNGHANVEGWHGAFDPSNRHGLLLINSSGGPSYFNLPGGAAGAPDIPRSVPAAVFMIHSFSAADPNDFETIAGRWLANGAFVYYGSMNEPMLHAFRTPRLLGELIGERLPMVVAARATLAEPYGTPWRLVYLGDPLYRLKPRQGVPPRSASWEPTDRWPSYSEAARPASSDDDGLLRWALKAALARLQPPRSRPGDDLIDVLLQIRRARLPSALRPIYDALLADSLFQAGRRIELRARIAAIPPAERTPDLRRWYETILAADVQLAVSRKDFSRARAAWGEIFRLDMPRDFKDHTTTRVGRLADTAVRLHDWSLLLRATLREFPRPPESDILATELKRVEEAVRAERRNSRSAGG